jgi:hypothetical protein
VSREWPQPTAAVRARRPRLQLMQATTLAAPCRAIGLPAFVATRRSEPRMRAAKPAAAPPSAVREVRDASAVRGETWSWGVRHWLRVSSSHGRRSVRAHRGHHVHTIGVHPVISWPSLRRWLQPSAAFTDDPQPHRSGAYSWRRGTLISRRFRARLTHGRRGWLRAGPRGPLRKKLYRRRVLSFILLVGPWCFGRPGCHRATS